MSVPGLRDRTQRSRRARGVLTGDQPDVGADAVLVEAGPVPDLDRQREPGQGRDPTQAPQAVHHRCPRRIGSQLRDPGIKAVPAGHHVQHLIHRFLQRPLAGRLLQPLPGQPRQVQVRPRLAVAVHDPVPQQQLRGPVPGPHQIGAAVLPGPDQVPGRPQQPTNGALARPRPATPDKPREPLHTV